MRIDTDLQLGFEVRLGDVTPWEYRALRQLHRARERKLSEEQARDHARRS